MIFKPLHLKLIEYAHLDGETNMRLDAGLLALCEASPGYGFLRFYTWTAPTLSMGRLEPDDAVDRHSAGRNGIAVVRRPTGGRTVLHGDDLTYTVVVPRPQDAGLQKTYNLFSEILVDGLSSMGALLDIERGKTGRSPAVKRPCFASVSRYEVTYEGRKLVGSAQRIGERAVLQHGSIPLGRGYMGVVDYMNVSSDAKESLRREMETGTCCLEEVLGKPVLAGRVADALGGAFQRRLGCDLVPLSLEDLDGLMAADHKIVLWKHRLANPSHKSP
jgi:lipoate-protein ligase A